MVDDPLISSYRDLKVWQDAMTLAERCNLTTQGFPRSETFGLVAEIRRAASSIPANIAEGYGRFSQAAYRNHLSIARGSAVETESWIDLLERRGYVSPQRATELYQKCDEIQRLLTLRMKSLGEKTYAIREESDEPYHVE